MKKLFMNYYSFGNLGQENKSRNKALAPYLLQGRGKGNHKSLKFVDFLKNTNGLQF